MTTIARVPVQSSNIRSVGYDAESQTLAVEFSSGAVYEYDGLPADVVESLLTAGSIGSYFARAIRAQYSGRKVG